MISEGGQFEQIAVLTVRIKTNGLGQTVQIQIRRRRTLILIRICTFLPLAYQFYTHSQV